MESWLIMLARVCRSIIRRLEGGVSSMGVTCYVGLMVRECEVCRGLLKLDGSRRDDEFLKNMT